MADVRNQVRPCAISRQDTSAALGAAWARISRKLGKGAFADRLDVDTKTVNRAIIGETVPELHTALNSLLADPTALDEVMHLYGFELRPVRALPANDLETVASISHLAGKWVEVLADGIRDHRETLALADAIGALLPNLNAIVAEGERLRGVAA